jgi:hypothetical protein
MSESFHRPYSTENTETIFWVKILKFFDADPGWKNSDPGSGMGKIRIRDKHPGSRTLLVHISTTRIFQKHFRPEGTVTINQLHAGGVDKIQ